MTCAYIIATCCRKKKAVHKVSTTDDKRLQATLKRLGVNTIPGIEEVNLFVDNDVIHFTNPKGRGAWPSYQIWLSMTPLSAFHALLLCHSATPFLTVLWFSAVQASIAANTFVVSGPSQTRSESALSLPLPAWCPSCPTQADHDDLDVPVFHAL